MDTLSNGNALQAIPRLRIHFCHASFCELSDTAFVSLEWIERATPSVREVEDGHVEYEHGIMHSSPAREHFSPFGSEISLLNSHFCFSPVNGYSNVCFGS